MAKTTRTAAKAAKVQFNMSASATDVRFAEADATDVALAAMIGDLDDMDIVDESDEIDVTVKGADIDDAHIASAAIEAAVAELDKIDANQAVYASETAEPTSEADRPKDLVDPAAPASTTVVAKTKKEPKVKAEKVAKEPKAPKAPAEPKAPRITYVGHTTSEVLAAKLGAKKADILVLEVADAGLEPDALAAKQEALLGDIDLLAKKVGEKAVMLFGWLNSGGKLNEVMERAFKVLAKDGQLVSGPKGNLHSNLREKYSEGTAASQSNQMFALFPALAITKREKGVMAINTDSLIFMKAKAELGLA